MTTMREIFTNEPFNIGPTEQQFKVSIGTGTASIQQQVDDEGFDEITGGNFTASGDGILGISGSQFKVVLSGDARFFMGILNNRR